MKNLDLCISYLCGHFNNSEQVQTELKNGDLTHPEAEHIIGIINDRIKNLPKDFKGYFVIEESHYKKGNFKNSMPHLFLFTENEDKKVVLTSYEIPKNISKEDFKNNNKTILLDYNELKTSKKFNPLVYDYINYGFEGESISNFSFETTFTLNERFEDGTLYVSEVFRKNGQITMGTVDPIIYKKIH